MTPEEIKGMTGRRVLIEGVLENCKPDEDGDVIVGIASHRSPLHHQCVHPSAIREILPEPIKVGSVVKEGEVLAIHGSQVWIKEPDGLCFTYPLSDLTLVEPCQ